MTPREHRLALTVRASALRAAASCALALLVVLATACGSDDGSADSTSADSVAAPVSGDAESSEEPAGGGAEAPSASDVAACLADAGYETTSNEEVLNEQQRADLEALFGQVDGLTFTGVAFAGGIMFFATPEQATTRADRLSEAAVELVPVGPTLISIEAGAGYEDAVAAAEACLA